MIKVGHMHHIAILMALDFYILVYHFKVFCKEFKAFLLKKSKRASISNVFIVMQFYDSLLLKIQMAKASV